MAEPTVKSDIPLGRVPHAVGVELYRKGWRNPIFAVARFDACAQFKADKSLNRMWATRGEEQLAKCAEAFGLRMVAPEECGNLYIDEEMGQSEPETPAVPTPTVIPPQPTVAPVVKSGGCPGPGSPSAPAPPATPAPAAQATPKPPVPAGPAPKSPPPPPPAARTAPAPPPAAPNPSPVPAAPVEPVAVTAARVNAQADQAKAEFVAKVAEQQTDLTPAEKQDIQGAMERDRDPVPAAPVTEPVVDAEAPASPTERQTFLNRAAKIVRDTMEGKAKVKEAGALLRSYFAKQAGVTDLKKITAAKWEQMISELEGIADPMAVAEKVKAGAK